LIDSTKRIRNSLISLAGIDDDSEATRRIGGKLLPGWKNLDSILQLNLSPELLRFLSSFRPPAGSSASKTSLK